MPVHQGHLLAPGPHRGPSADGGCLGCSEGTHSVQQASSCPATICHSHIAAAGLRWKQLEVNHRLFRNTEKAMFRKKPGRETGLDAEEWPGGSGQEEPGHLGVRAGLAAQARKPQLQGTAPP